MREARVKGKQVVSIVRTVDRGSVAAVATQRGISDQTIYTWRHRFGTVEASAVWRLKQLETENARLKKLRAERNLEVEVMKEIPQKMVCVPACLAVVAYAARRGLSKRQVCTLISVGRSALRYRPVKDGNDAPVLARMAVLSAQYPRYGYRRNFPGP